MIAYEMDMSYFFYPSPLHLGPILKSVEIELDKDFPVAMFPPGGGTSPTLGERPARPNRFA